MPYVATDSGIRAYYDQVGSGPALVMVHGASQDSLSWKYVVALFAAHYTVYTLDLPGHGKSDMPENGPHTATQDNASYLLAFLEAASIDQALLMGHSMGGGVVMQAAATDSTRVRGLALIDGASVNVVKSSGYNPNILKMASINPSDWFEVTFRTLMGSKTGLERALGIVTDARRCIPEVAFADICAFSGFRMEQILERVHCPVVIAEGGDDWSVPPESARQVEQELRKRGVPIAYIEWPGIGHFPQSECPEQFARDTLGALKSLSL